MFRYAFVMHWMVKLNWFRRNQENDYFMQKEIGEFSHSLGYLPTLCSLICCPPYPRHSSALLTAYERLCHTLFYANMYFRIREPDCLCD
jgi:hypothetical protein